MEAIRPRESAIIEGVIRIAFCGSAAVGMRASCKNPDEKSGVITAWTIEGEGIKSVGHMAVRIVALFAFLTVLAHAESSHRILIEVEKYKITIDTSETPDLCGWAADKLQPVVKEWLDTAGPHGKEVLRIASRYANGPSGNFIRDMAK